METVDRVLFRSRPWQMFLVIFGVWLANVLLFLHQPGWRGMIGDFLPVTVLMIWMMMLGIRLNVKLPRKYSTHFYLFIVSGLLIIATTILVALFKNKIMNSERAIVIAVVLIITAGPIFFSFLARVVKYLETKGKASFADYFIDTWLWTAWIITVWIQAPRLNRIYDEFYSGNAN